MFACIRQRMVFFLYRKAPLMSTIMCRDVNVNSMVLFSAIKIKSFTSHLRLNWHLTTQSVGDDSSIDCVICHANVWEESTRFGIALEKPNERKFYHNSFISSLIRAPANSDMPTKAMTARRSVNVWPKKKPHTSPHWNWFNILFIDRCAVRTRSIARLFGSLSVSHYGALAAFKFYCGSLDVRRHR